MTVLNAQQVQMQIDGVTITISDTTKIKIDGNFRMFTTAQIDNDGLIEIGGYFINSGTSDGFINRNNKGELLLKRTATPTFISGNVPLYFEKLTLDNSQGIDYSNDIFIENELEFINGKLYSPNDFVIILNDNGNTIIGANNSNYITGKMRQYVINSQSYDFPIGSQSDYKPATLNIQNIGTSNFIEAEFIPETVTPTNLILDSTNITTFLNSGFWRFDNPTANDVLFDLTATSNGHINGGNTAAEHALFRRTNGTWENAGTHNNATQSGNLNNAITAKRTDVQGLGDFIIGRGEYTIATNPVLHGNFKFINAFQFSSDLDIEFIGLENMDYQVHLIDLNGGIIETQKVANFSTAKHVNFDVANLSTNIYIIAISTVDFLFTKQIFID
jgi:hypothetical protein